MEAHARETHAILDCESRVAKARKIEEILRGERDLTGARILDVGTGAGFTAARLAAAAGPEGEVWAVDIIDQRQVTEGVRFVTVSDTTLPFEDRFFDIVVSNHVVEHVGGRQQQLDHLREIRRVLRNDGCGYFGSPNRWGVLEPHFRLPFLSWLPSRFRTPYVRAARRGRRYDCEPPSHGEIVAMLDLAGLDWVEKTFEAMRALARIESPRQPLRALLEAPAWLLRLLHPIIPIMIFIVRPTRELVR